MSKLKPIFDLEVIKDVKRTILINNVSGVTHIIKEVKEGKEQYFFNVDISGLCMSVIREEKDEIEEYRVVVIKALEKYINKHFKAHKQGRKKLMKEIYKSLEKTYKLKKKGSE